MKTRNRLVLRVWVEARDHMLSGLPTWGLYNDLLHDSRLHMVSIVLFLGSLAILLGRHTVLALLIFMEETNIFIAYSYCAFLHKIVLSD